MKLPKNYFENLSASKYREYLKLLPDMRHENTRIITSLILTFIAMSFFGIFAINPTLSTIVTLKKQLSDSILVNEKLGTKINNLSSLQQQYTNLSPDLPYVFDAIPQNPKAPSLMGEIAALAQKKKIQITSLTISQARLTDIVDSPNGSSYAFALQTKGDYNDLMNFTKSLVQLSRIIKIETLSVTKEPTTSIIILGINGRGYFKK